MQNMSKQIIAIAALAITVIAIGTWYQAKYSERWTQLTSEELDHFTAQVQKFPRVLGKWTGTDDPPISDDVWKRTNCTAYISRVYQNSETGKQVSMYLVSGAAKHITIHSPDWCFVGAGYQLEGKVENYVVKFPPGGDIADPEFATAIFRKPDIAEQGLRIFWTYSYDGIWKGPTHPNWAKAAYGGRPAMFKIYLIAEPGAPAESPCLDFVKELFPEINERLFAPAATPGESEQPEPSDTDLEL
jgi:hypothetical protein